MDTTLRHTLTHFVASAVLALCSHAQCSDWSALGTGIGGPVFCSAVYDSGTGPQLYVGGSFSVAGGVVANNVARWNGTSWSSVGAGGGGGGVQGGPSPVVTAMRVFDDGSGPKLYVAGRFTSGGGTANGVARWNGTSWSTLGTGLRGIAGAIGRSLMEYDPGTGPRLYLGGVFNSVNGVAAASVASWDGTSWAPLGTGVQGGTFPTVHALEVFDDGTGPKLYAGGTFAQAGSVTDTGLARWDGSTWSALTGWPDGPVYALLAHDDGAGSALFVGGGFFSSFPGAGVGRGIARWNGASWSTLAGGLGSGWVEALAEHHDGISNALYIGGSFTTLVGTPANNVARWNGSSWSQLDMGTFQGVRTLTSYSLAPPAQPRLLAAGDFVSAGPLTVSGIAEWEACRIQSLCTGDGEDDWVACPCGNGALGQGCRSSTGHGAQLATSGSAQPLDALFLDATALPTNSLVIFLKGGRLEGEFLLPFGDGVRCVGGTLIRFGQRTAVAGATQYPTVPGNQPLSVVGHTPVGSGAIAYYQAYYRDVGTYCTVATFNITNAIKVIW